MRRNTLLKRVATTLTMTMLLFNTFLNHYYIKDVTVVSSEDGLVTVSDKENNEWIFKGETDKVKIKIRMDNNGTDFIQDDIIDDVITN